MTEDERYELALSLATEKTKQLLTLSTGVLAITISFSKDILGGVVAWTVIPLTGAWVLYLLSIVFGVQVLGQFAARLLYQPINEESVVGNDIVKSADRQIGCFICAVFLTVTFGICMAGVVVHDAKGLTKRIGSSNDPTVKNVSSAIPCVPARTP